MNEVTINMLFKTDLQVHFSCIDERKNMEDLCSSYRTEQDLVVNGYDALNLSLDRQWLDVTTKLQNGWYLVHLILLIMGKYSN